jgi:hypothetical protein
MKNSLQIDVENKRYGSVSRDFYLPVTQMIVLHLINANTLKTNECVIHCPA